MGGGEKSKCSNNLHDRKITCIFCEHSRHSERFYGIERWDFNSHNPFFIGLFFNLFMTRRLSLESWNPAAVFKMYGIKCAYEVLESLLQPEARACRANWFYKQLFDELVNIKDLRYVGKVLSGEQWSSKGWERAAEQYQLLSICHRYVDSCISHFQKHKYRKRKKVFCYN